MTRIKRSQMGFKWTPPRKRMAPTWPHDTEVMIHTGYMIVEDIGHRNRCPDCWYPLERVTIKGPLECTNPDCPVIRVIKLRPRRGMPYNAIKVTRAARAR